MIACLFFLYFLLSLRWHDENSLSCCGVFIFSVCYLGDIDFNWEKKGCHLFTYRYLLDFAFGTRDGQPFGHACISCLACLELYWEWDKHLLLQKTNGRRKQNKTKQMLWFTLI